MKKNDLIWIFASVLLLSVAAFLIFLPHSAKDNADKPAFDPDEKVIEIPAFSEQDSDDVLAESSPGKRVQTTAEEEAGIEADMQAIGKLCGAYYLQAEKVPSEYVDRENISRTDIDTMETAVSSAGCCVTNSDAVYPEYLENPESLNRFWDDVTNENDAAATVWSISPSGSVSCRVFQYADGKSYCIHASGEWDDDGSLRLSYLEKKEICLSA